MVMGGGGYMLLNMVIQRGGECNAERERNLFIKSFRSTYICHSFSSISFGTEYNLNKEIKY